MHFVLGLLGLLSTLVLTWRLGHGGQFTGLFHAPAMVLLLGAPLAMAVMSYPFEELATCMRALMRALRFSPSKSRALLFEELTRFAELVRGRKSVEALAMAEGAAHPLLRQLGPLVVRGYGGEDIERTAGTATFVLASGLKRSEEVLGTLSRASPAAGLVGTVLGLIQLLSNLSSFETIGPSMALALLCTLYGLLLANGVYQPLGRALKAFAVARVEESKLLTRALLLVREGKPLADVRALFTDGGTAAPAEAAAQVAGGGA